MVLQQDVLRPLALCEQRQRLSGDVGLEVSALLMRLEGSLVAEQFVEKELRRVFLVASNQEQLRTWVALGFRQEEVEYGGNSVGLPFLRFPLRDDEDAAICDGVSDRLLIHG